MQEVLNLSQSMRRYKRFVNGRLVMRDHIVLLCDVGRLVLLERCRIFSEAEERWTSQWREVDSVDTRNAIPNASITSVSISKGYFMIVGSKLWLYKLIPSQVGGQGVGTTS